MDKMVTTRVMTTEETRVWLNSFFAVSEDWKIVYKGEKTTIYEWSLDENIEVIETIDDITVNFYEDACSGTPYRTGTVRVDK